MKEDERRFIVDAMLGNLVSWLRILGYDTIYWDGGDKELIKRAVSEKRIILTMDRRLALNAIRVGAETLYIARNSSPQILAELARRYGLRLDFDPERTRCPICNGILKVIDVDGREEWVCPTCGKKYWRGSHWKNIMKTINEARKRVRLLK